MTDVDRVLSSSHQCLTRTKRTLVDVEPKVRWICGHLILLLAGGRKAQQLISHGRFHD